MVLEQILTSPNPFVTLVDLAIGWSVFLLTFLISLALVYGFFRLTRPLLKRALVARRLPFALVDFAQKTYRNLLFVAAPVFALAMAGVDVTLLVAALGVGAIVIAMTARGIVENFIAGFLIFWDKPFFIGDTLEVDGVRGRVVEITLTTTHLRTETNRYVIVPNRDMHEKPMTNFSKRGAVRVDVRFFVPQEEGMEALCQSILSRAKKLKGVEKTPPPSIKIAKLSSSGTWMRLEVWTQKNEHEMFSQLAKLVHKDVHG